MELLWLPSNDSNRQQGYRQGRADKLLGLWIGTAATSRETEYARGDLTGQAGEKLTRFTIDAVMNFTRAHEDTLVRVSVHMGFSELEEAEDAARQLRMHYPGYDFIVREVKT